MRQRVGNEVRDVIGRDTDVMFNESARIYRLPRSLAGYDGFLRLLREANATGGAVEVRLTAPHGEVIESIKAPENA